MPAQRPFTRYIRCVRSCATGGRMPWSCGGTRGEKANEMPREISAGIVTGLRPSRPVPFGGRRTPALRLFPAGGADVFHDFLKKYGGVTPRGQRKRQLNAFGEQLRRQVVHIN